MSNKPKLLLVFPYFPPDPGAAAVRGESYAKYLAKDFEVSVITKDNHKFEQYRDLSSTRRLLLKVSFSPLKLWQDYRQLSEEIVKIDPDLVLASAPNYLLAALAIFVTKKLKKPAVADLRDQTFAGSAIKRFLNKLLFKYIVTKAERVFVTTEEQKEQVLESIPGIEVNKIKIVPNGVDVDLYPLNLPEWSKREVDILFLGSINPERNLDELADFCREIVEAKIPAGKELKIRFVGFDPKSPSAEMFVQKLPNTSQIEFLGEVNHMEAKRQTTMAKFGIVSITPNPDLAYMMPVKVFEYMAGGAVVLGLFDSSSKALARFFKTFAVGMHSQNGKDLAQKVLMQMKNEQAWAEVGNQNRENSREFSRQKIIEGISNELQSLVHSAGRNN